MNTAGAEMTAVDPFRLGVALNYSVFLYELMDDREGAMSVARNAFNESIALIDTISDETYRDSTLIMQLIRDNLSLWEMESQDDYW